MKKHSKIFIRHNNKIEKHMRFSEIITNMIFFIWFDEVMSLLFSTKNCLLKSL